MDGDVTGSSTMDGDVVDGVIGGGSAVDGDVNGLCDRAVHSIVSVNVDTTHVSTSGASQQCAFSLLSVFHFCITG